MIIGADAMFAPLWAWWKAGSQKAIVHDVDERHHRVPPFIVEPHLGSKMGNYIYF